MPGLVNSTYVPLGSESAFTTGNLAYHQTPADGSKPYDILYPQTELPETNVIYKNYSTKIRDLRPLIDSGVNPTDVNVTGFQVLDKVQGATSMTEEDFGNDELIREKYYNEVKSLLKRITGCTRVEIFDHTVRRVPSASQALEQETAETRAPVSRVHIDQTQAAGRLRVEMHTGVDAERLLKGRCQLINLWRPLRSTPVHDIPLAVCDARTLDAKVDLVKSRLIYEDREGETFQVKHSPNHSWYYLSEMVRDEALLLQCWTNDEDGSGAKTPHTAFVDDAYVGKITIPRQSIEVRCLLFYEGETTL